MSHRKPLFSAIGVLCLLISLAAGQSKQVTRQTQIWLRYYNQTKLSGQWTTHIELEEREFLSPSRVHARFLPRIQLISRIGAGWEGGVGLAYILQAQPQDPARPVNVMVPEWRPHLALTYKQKTGSLGISHRYWLEERFVRNSTATGLRSGYQFTLRCRYRLQVEVPVLDGNNGLGSLKARGFDEVFLNLGHNIIRNTFDQNRIGASLVIGISSKLAVEAGYFNWFQERSSGDQYYSRDIVRFTLHHSVAL